MKATLVALALAPAAALLAPAAKTAPATAAAAIGKSPSVLGGVGETAPFCPRPGACWDPVGFTERTSDSLMLWYRAAELKHSRVAMLACAGWITNGLGLYFPGKLASGVDFSSLSKNPLEAWAQTPHGSRAASDAFGAVVPRRAPRGRQRSRAPRPISSIGRGAAL